VRGKKEVDLMLEDHVLVVMHDKVVSKLRRLPCGQSAVAFEEVGERSLLVEGTEVVVVVVVQVVGKQMENQLEDEREDGEVKRLKSP
jgi:hypothetical protein